MKQNQKFNLDYLAGRFEMYNMLKDYYNGKPGEELEACAVVSSLREMLKDDDGLLDKGIRFISRYDQEAVYDFNRLFVGPGKLLAPPYESAYRNPERMLMQKETLMVRNFYASAGIKVRKQNSQPDDFIGLELEFICYLLFKTGEYLDKEPEKAEHYLLLYYTFIREHLGKWIFEHCQDILNNSSSDFCKGMAMITKSFIENELKNAA